ncbi:uncharacterized protein PV07_01468 [Cladophialophora immunda]|uniref:Kelch repeat protein n=1 Tax=Cladophialophora immunda TaxID=569365 RepID=A0A0D2DG43_9EURO|nr:uncharacterized protein PV07_01468 [Cladophialophora immunda]KIW34709.1 hypothetical protein PV07_01468 [Cladophialophora immunda]
MVLGTWKKYVSSSLIRRSSQTLAVIEKTAYIYGGELHPREPVDSGVYACSIVQGSSSPECQVSAATVPQAPQPRVGSASTALKGKVYVFSGRGGTAMAPIEEHGAFWSFDPTTQSWSEITPRDPQSPFPPGRSYHALANDGNDMIYLHAGCPEKDRLSDLWSFSVSQRKWHQHAAAPDPARGGTSIAFARGKLWRMNGFDGAKEQGGTLDVFDPGNVHWNTISFAADGREGPGPRSVCCLLALKIGGRDSLLTMFGESDPSNLGHQGAGKMLGDIWVFDIESGHWQEVRFPDGEDKPMPRGWFAADVVADSSVIIQGGLSASNERLDDVWLLEFE